MAAAKNSIRVLKPFKFSMGDGSVLSFECIETKEGRRSRLYEDVPDECFNHPWVAHGKADGHIEGDVSVDKATGKPINTAALAGSAASDAAIAAKVEADKAFQDKIDAAVASKVDAAVAAAVAAALAQAKATK